MPGRRPRELHQTVAAYETVAAAYEAGRPAYPPEAVGWVVEEAAIGPGREVLDLAAGTGKLTRLLAETGAHLIAVEPVPSFRDVLAQLPVDVLAGTAEQIPLPDESVDAVTVAAAFHWFDPAPAVAEIARVLRSGGMLAILWNERDSSDETQRALTALLEPHRRDEPRQADEAWLQAFVEEPRFTPLRKRDFTHLHPFTAETLLERVKSISFVAALADDRRALLLQAVSELAEKRAQSGPHFLLPHTTHVYVASRCALARNNR
jgi:SAM-dependent methyltransferase